MKHHVCLGAQRVSINESSYGNSGVILSLIIFSLEACRQAVILTLIVVQFKDLLMYTYSS